MFTYNNINVEGFGISPSGIAKFFSYPSVWYKEHVLGENGFVGNTSSVLGTIVHQTIESFCKGELTDTGTFNEAVSEFVHSEAIRLAELDVELDTDLILAQYKPMAMAAINDYVRNNPPEQVEGQLTLELEPGFWLKGTFDAYSNGTVIDWKTTGLMSAPKEIPWGYKIQSLAYAKMLIASGTPVDRIAIGYITRDNVGRISEKTGKKLTDYPSKITMLYHQITDDDWKELDDALQLIVDSVRLVQEQPDLAYIIFKSMSIKEK